jgi:hypothetical protein
LFGEAAFAHGLEHFGHMGALAEELVDVDGRDPAEN